MTFEEKLEIVSNNYANKYIENVNTKSMVHKAYCEGFKVGYKKATTNCQPQIHSLCKYCNRKPVFDSTGHYEPWSNKETVATGAYSSLSIGVDASGKLIMIGGGDDDTDPYYPKYCPECGRKLT